MKTSIVQSGQDLIGVILRRVLGGIAVGFYSQNLH